MEYLSSSSSSSMIYGPLFPQNDHQLMFPTPAYGTPYSTDHPLQSSSDHDPTMIITPQLPLQNHDDHDDDLDQLLSQISPSFLDQLDDHHHQNMNSDHLHHHHQGGTSNHNNNYSNSDKKKGRKTSLLVASDDHDHDDDEDKMNEKKKKQRLLHREIERQRRLEMSSLHASLRSLLPIEYIKGKRSMSEHFNETVKYIKHLQQRIQALSSQRDALKLKASNDNSNDSKNHDDGDGDGDGDDDDDDFEVRVHHCSNGGVEVIVSTSEKLPLSRILQCLFKQGFDVVNCISNRKNNRLVHSIQAQVEDGRSKTIDAIGLKQKLAKIP